MDNVYEYPAIGILVLVELSAVEGKLHKNIIIFNLSILDSFQIIATADGITIFLDLPTVCSGILKNVSRCSCTIVHFVRSLARPIESLNYRTQGNSNELSPRISCTRVITLFFTHGTMIAVGQGASEFNACIKAHVIEDWHHTAELLDALLHLPKQKERIVRIALNHIGPNGIVDRLQGICCREESTKSLYKMFVRSNIEAGIWLSSAEMINVYLLHIALL